MVALIGKDFEVGGMVVELGSVFMVDDMFRLKRKDLSDDVSGGSGAVAVDKERVSVSVFEPGEVTLGIAKVMFGTAEEAAGFGYRLIADRARCSNVCGDSFRGFDPGFLEGFIDSLARDVVFGGEVDHGDEVGFVGCDDLGLFGGRQVVKNGGMLH